LSAMESNKAIMYQSYIAIVYTYTDCIDL
jgi:hypothetical protein